MAKKIYDIKPPKLVRKTEERTVPKASLVDVKHTKRPTRKKKEGRSIWWPISIGAAVVLLIIGVYLFFKLPKATIVIWPKVDILGFKQTITADKTADLVDIAKAVIPAQYFEASKTISQDFPATGNATNEGYAAGNITIYNKFDPPAPFTFKAGTRFVSDSGKLFISSQKVVIPAAKKVGSKITPGSVQIKVQAVEGGSDYNIAPSNFSIPGLKGTAYYYSIYAVSTSAMTGGYSGKVKKVTDDDIQGAKEVLTKKTTDDAIANLKAQISSDYILLNNAVLSKVTSASTQTKSGTVVENFNYNVAVTASALAFKKSDLDKYVRSYIISQMPEGKTLLDSNLKIDYSASTVDVSGGKAVLNLDFSSGVYKNIDKNSLSLSMLGENADQMRVTIANSLEDQVSNTKISFWPFWVTSAPNSQKAVNIELEFQ